MPKVSINIDICPSTFLKNPMDTELGKSIIKRSIVLFSKIGFEDFNFKKLAKEMASTEASIYRYFENKYKLLSYLVAWYWDYLHYIILFDIRNIDSAKDRMHIIIKTLINATGLTTVPTYIDMAALHILVVENASKVYHNKQVDKLKEEGFYNNLQKLVKTISSAIMSIDKKYKYPVALANTVIDMSLNTEYNIIHFPGLTDFDKSKSINPRQETVRIVEYIIDKSLNI